MKEQVRTLYRCEYCSKYRISKSAMLNHEKWCSKNPANTHACLSCRHLTVDRFSGDGYNEKTFTCDLLKKELHSYKAEKIDHSCLIRTERMPVQCESYQVENYGF